MRSPCRNSLLVAATLVVAILASACRAPPPHAPAAPAAATACVPAPLEQTLFLRGSMTTWALRDDLAFVYSCDSYYLNVTVHGTHDFRITSARGGEINLGAAAGDAVVQPGQPFALKAAADGGGRNLRFAFTGEHTLRVRISADGAQITIGPKTFVDPAAAPVEDVVARSLRFDSRDRAHKAPFGATTAGGEVEFRLDAAPGVDRAELVIERRRLEGPQAVLDYSEVARVPLSREPRDGHDTWGGRYRFDAIGVYGYYFVIDVAGRRFVYENNADPVYWTRELGSNGAGAVAALADPRRVRHFRHTVYREDFRVPDWARDVIFYYIFPERFRNGDPGNDPRPGAGTFHAGSVEAHANWLDKPWLPHSGDGSDDLYGNDFFGGDLAGIIEKLDYIHALGANTLYLTPIFRAASNHKYDTADYRNIDPHFGSNADFERLTREASQRGMRVILDTSLNHTGSDSIYFNRYGNYPEVGAFDRGQIRTDSPYASWYRFFPGQSDPNRQYRGWEGARDLPEIDKSSPGFRAFAYGDADSVMNLWLDRGAAGWRMDVAPWIPDDFWREWRAAVKRHRPDALTIAEAQFESSKFFLGDEFDSTMNYVFRNAVQAYANGADARTSYRNIELIRELYPAQTFFALMNLLSTHDSARALHEFGYRDANTGATAIALAKRRLHLAVLFQMIFPGAPTVFYGDEVGVTGGEDPFNRATYPWADRGGRPDASMLADFKRLIALRNTHAVLRHGSIDAPIYLDEHVIVLLRRDGAHWAVTATNNADDARQVRIELPAGLRDSTFKDGFGNASVRAAGTMLAFSVPALDGRVLLKE